MVNNGMIWELPSGYLTLCEPENEPFSSMMYLQKKWWFSMATLNNQRVDGQIMEHVDKQMETCGTL
jgi:hypothetical protein